MVELAAGVEADLVPHQQLRRSPGRADLQRRQPDPLLGRGPGPRGLCRAGLEATFAGTGADRRRVRIPVRAVDPDRARDVRIPLPDGGDLRDDRDRLRRRRAPAPSGLAGACDCLPRAGGDRRRADLPARLRTLDAGLVRQCRPCPSAVELQLPVPRPADRKPGRAHQPRSPEAAGRHRSRGAGRGLRARRPAPCSRTGSDRHATRVASRWRRAARVSRRCDASR